MGPNRYRADGGGGGREVVVGRTARVAVSVQQVIVETRRSGMLSQTTYRRLDKCGDGNNYEC